MGEISAIFFYKHIKRYDKAKGHTIANLVHCFKKKWKDFSC